jgi:hypothetical protein
MNRRMSLFLFAVSIFLLAHSSSAPAQVPDGTLKITSRMASPGVGLSWGDGVLTYKGRDYPFVFKASGLFRDVESEMTGAELSGQVFNLKNLEDFSGNYQKVESHESVSGGASRATIKNQKGVEVNLVSKIEGRKFDIGREGLNVQLKK